MAVPTAQVAALSLAVATFRPVEMRFWVFSRFFCVDFSDCRAVRAPLLVRIELTMIAPFKGSGFGSAF
ncbi:hypothetical protein HMPREF9946_02944 [Acetobacteraceae bacterium AT-5844]|nr:hypothetical protein HMPREF9946_02944 [Acetobacteraceae bacterium AT-5844]